MNIAVLSQILIFFNTFVLASLIMIIQLISDKIKEFKIILFYNFIHKNFILLFLLVLSSLLLSISSYVYLSFYLYIFAFVISLLSITTIIYFNNIYYLKKNIINFYINKLNKAELNDIIIVIVDVGNLLNKILYDVEFFKTLFTKFLEKYLKIISERNDKSYMDKILYINILFHFIFKEVDILKNTLIKFIFKRIIEELYSKLGKNIKLKELNLLRISLITFMLDQIINQTIKKIHPICISYAGISLLLHQYCTDKYLPKNNLEPRKTNSKNFIKNILKRHKKCKGELLNFILALESSLMDALPFFVTNHNDIKNCIHNFINEINNIITDM